MERQAKRQNHHHNLQGQNLLEAKLIDLNFAVKLNHSGTNPCGPEIRASPHDNTITRGSKNHAKMNNINYK